jgi:DNA-binding transcriptional regulator YhcF (GntR family)
VTLLKFVLRRGEPIVGQVVRAATGAILRGEYRPGQPFPSVRAIAASLKIHPNTAHKAVQLLIEERWLESRLGTGTVVAEAPRAPDRATQRVIRDEIDRLVVLARGQGMSLDAVVDDLQTRWASYDRTHAE